MANWIPFPWGKTKQSEEEAVDVENYVENLKVSQDGFMEEEGIVYVKPMDLSSDTSVDDTIKEFRQGNIVILDISKMMGNSPDLYKRIKAIKKHCLNNGGDVCRVSQVKIMVLPEGIEVTHTAGSRAEPDEDE